MRYLSASVKCSKSDIWLPDKSIEIRFKCEFVLIEFAMSFAPEVIPTFVNVMKRIVLVSLRSGAICLRIFGI